MLASLQDVIYNTYPNPTKAFLEAIDIAYENNSKRHRGVCFEDGNFLVQQPQASIASALSRLCIHPDGGYITVCWVLSRLSQIRGTVIDKDGGRVALCELYFLLGFVDSCPFNIVRNAKFENHDEQLEFMRFALQSIQETHVTVHPGTSGIQISQFDGRKLSSYTLRTVQYLDDYLRRCGFYKIINKTMGSRLPPELQSLVLNQLCEMYGLPNGEENENIWKAKKLSDTCPSNNKHTLSFTCPILSRVLWDTSRRKYIVNHGLDRLGLGNYLVLVESPKQPCPGHHDAEFYGSRQTNASASAPVFTMPRYSGIAEYIQANSLENGPKKYKRST